MCGAWQALAGWLNVSTTWDAPLFFGEFGAEADPVKVRNPRAPLAAQPKRAPLHA